jgi:hypothetical protein
VQPGADGRAVAFERDSVGEHGHVELYIAKHVRV